MRDMKKEFQSTRSQDRDPWQFVLHYPVLVFQSTRSQDRDAGRKRKVWQEVISIHSVARPRLPVGVQLSGNYLHFNPLGRKTETIRTTPRRSLIRISIHSVARPRPFTPPSLEMSLAFQSTRSQDRDVFTIFFITLPDISIHSVARPRHSQTVSAGISTIISIHSVARPRPVNLYIKWGKHIISIHSVARPRPFKL